MSNSTFGCGDLVMARFRPDNVGVVEKVYGELCDLRRPGRQPLGRVPVKALTPIPNGVTLFAVGVTAFDLMRVEGIVAGEDGLHAWMRHQPAITVARASICAVDSRLQPCTQWQPLVGLLVAEAAREVEKAVKEAGQSAQPSATV